MNIAPTKAGVLLALVLSASLSAQKAPAGRKSDVVVLDMLSVDVVTATKTSKKVEDVPAVIEVITAADIRQRGYRQLADVLNDLPDNHEDRGNWGIGEPLYQNSGMGFRFDTGQNLLLLMNGFRLNAFLPGNRFGGEEYLLDDIDHIEVLRGPGSALYGANAFTTVVNVITRSASSENAKTTASFQGAQHGAITGMGGASRKFGSNGFVSGAVRGATDPGSTLHVDNDLFGANNLRDGIRHAFDAEGSASVGKLALYGKATNQRRRTVTGFNGVNPSDDDKLALSMYGYFLGAQYVADPTEHVQLKWSGEWHQDNWTEVALIPMFQLNASGTGLEHDAQGQPILDRSMTVQRDGTTMHTPFVIDGQGADTRTVEGEAQLTWNYRGGNNIIVGVNVGEDKVLHAVRPSEIQLNPFEIVSFRRFTDDANSWLADDHASRATSAAYVQADYDTGRWSFTLGGRLDRYTGKGVLDQTYTEFNPRGGVVFNAGDVGHLKLLYGSATRVPNGFETLSSVAILGTPLNRPEHIRTIQALWLRGWGRQVSTELGTFSSEITNHLVTDAAISDAMQAQGFIGQFRNVPAGQVLKSHGVDGKVMARAGRLAGAVNFTRYFDTDNGSGAQVPYIPMTMVNANGNVAFGWTNVNVGANYRSEFTKPADDPRAPVPAYVQTSANVIVHPPAVAWELVVGGHNLLDADVRAPSSSRDFVNHFPGRGREFSAMMRRAF